MPSLSLRLSEELDRRLKKEAERQGLPRAQVVRIAIREFFERKERDRFIAELVEDVRAAYDNEEIRQEALALCEEFAVSDDEALDFAEGRRAGEDVPEEPSEKWWW